MTVFRLAFFAVLLCACAALPARAQECTFALDYSTLRLGPAAGNGGLRITNSAACGAPTRSVSSTAEWLTVFGGGTPTVSLTFNFSANTTGAARTAVIVIDGIASVTVTQDVTACVVNVTPASAIIPVTGGSTTVTIQTTTPDCLASVGGFPGPPPFGNPLRNGWLVPGTNSQGFGGNRFIAFEIGSRTYTVTASSNGFATEARAVTLVFGGGPAVEISQPAPTCQFTFDPASVTIPAAGGSVNVSLTGVGSDCSYSTTVVFGAATVTSGQSGVAPATVTVAMPANTEAFARSATIHAVNGTLSITQAGPPVAVDAGNTNFIAIGFGAVRQQDGSVRVTSPERLLVTNEVDPAATWSAVASAPWILLAPAAGTSPGQLQISVDPVAVASMTPGFVTGTVDIFSSAAPVTPRRLNINLWYYAGQPATPTTTPFGVVPFGFVDTPGEGATGLAGAIALTGWAIDGLMLTRVTVYRDAVAGETPGEIFIGDAVRVFGARPDLRPFYSWAPEWRYAGWGYMLLSNVLPNGGNGTFTFSIYADDVEGNHTLLGRRTVTIDNANAVAPFGTIDEPAQGQTVSGTIVNRGWILTPGSKQVPTDGSTIKVYIDGALVGPVTSYNLPRPDVKSYFPGLTNSDGPEARLSIDTTQFADGVHTIAWGVVDSNGDAAGIGSRFFTIQNNGSSQTTAGSSTQTRAASTVRTLAPLGTEVWAQVGVDDARPSFRLDPDAQGRRRIDLLPGERLELTLDRWIQAWCGTYEGHQMTGAVANLLPLGASLDRDRGVFRWQPTAEFSGRFDFVFVQRGCDGIERRIPITVVLRPR